MKKIDYYKPASLSEALSLMEKYGSDLKILAGGTNLVVNLKEKKVQPKIIMDIKDLSELSGIRINASGEGSIGPLTTISSINRWCKSNRHYDNLISASEQLGSFQIRNRATVGGNLCDGSPCADTAIALLTYDANLIINDLGKERIIALNDFFIGPGQVDLKPSSILTEIRIPKLPDKRGESFHKLGYRKAMNIAIAGVSVVISQNSSSKIVNEVRIALSSVAPTPMRAIKSENLIRQQKWNEDLLEEAANIAASETSPISDIRASAEYRREMVKVYVKRALREAWDRVKLKS